MNLVLFAHPPFLHSQSMPRFAGSLKDAFIARGHQVAVRMPRPVLRRVVTGMPLAKWAGYVDQYLLFPHEIRSSLRNDPEDTLYVFCDQALGPWIPAVAHRPHVVHCHDFLALRSALGLIPENPTAFTGRVYQRYIRRGFQQARHFISVSERTRQDLHEFGLVKAHTSEVVHNELNFPFVPMAPDAAAGLLAQSGLVAPAEGMLVHISGAQWYKNVAGVMALYRHYALQQARPLPLWLVGVPHDAAMKAAVASLPAGAEVHFLCGLSSSALNAVYALARALLFPSLAEGFGWPIVEAQACGCPVVSTDDAPMNEVGGPHTTYLPRLLAGDDRAAWAAAAATVVQNLLKLPLSDRAALRLCGIAWSARFNAGQAVDQYLKIYESVLIWERACQPSTLTKVLKG